MTKKVIALMLSCALFLGAVPAVSAASGSDMTDISGIWAEEDINWVLEEGLFNGTSATQFSPDQAMSRGMFVTVLGRFAGINADEYDSWYLSNLYEDVNPDSYFAPYINWATRYGITTGTEAGKFNPDAPITREQMATFMVRYANIFGCQLQTISDSTVDAFVDIDTVNSYAVEAVEVMRRTGILNGRATQDGYAYEPFDNATRAECAAVFHRMAQSLVVDKNVQVIEPSSITLSDSSVEMEQGGTHQLSATIYTANSTINALTWVSSDPSIATVDRNGLVTGVGDGTCEIYAYACSGVYAVCKVTSGAYVGYAGESYASKCMHLYGEVVSECRRPYNDMSKEYCDSQIVTISVKVWDFTDKNQTEKTTKTMKLKVHKNLALTFSKIFEEIYACDAQYPIHYLGGYNYKEGGKSEHITGTAVDINYNENYYCKTDGTAITGSHWDPENDPYSIPVGGEIDQIFEKYGFTRGIYWNNGYLDYMHYSFFGK